jgi:hypothetical protein
MLRTARKTVTVTAGITCDACNNELDEIEGQDALSFRDTGGPTAPWGDGVTIGVDLCPSCVMTILRSWLRVDPDIKTRRRYPITTG